tara:strand:+ start:4445 stop:4657 length:213 start_codon:yes stop_codon:yes gene_type:complete
MSYEIKIEKVPDEFGTMYRIICPDLLYLKELGQLHSEIDKMFIENNNEYTQQDVYNDIYNEEKISKHKEG